MDILDILKSIFNDYGVDIDDQDYLYSIDSVQYMAILVEIENQFGISFPDEFLSEDIFTDIESVVKLIQYLQIEDIN